MHVFLKMEFKKKKTQIVVNIEFDVNADYLLYYWPWQSFFRMCWISELLINLCNVHRCTFFTVYNTVTFILTCTFTSVSKPKIWAKEGKAIFCVLLHNMCDFVPNQRLLFSLCVHVLQCTCTNVFVWTFFHFESLLFIMFLNYLFHVCWSSPLKVTSSLLASIKANIIFFFLTSFFICEVHMFTSLTCFHVYVHFGGNHWCVNSCKHTCSCLWFFIPHFQL